MKYQGWFDKILLILKLQFAKLKPELLSLFPDTRSYSNKMSELVRSLRFQSLLQLPFVFPFLVFSSPLQPLAHKPTGCPKKMRVLSTYDFHLGRGIFRGKLWEQRMLGCLAKFWVNGPCFVQNLPIFLNFQDYVSFKISKIIWKVKIFNIYMWICINIDFCDI